MKLFSRVICSFIVILSLGCKNSVEIFDHSFYESDDTILALSVKIADQKQQIRILELDSPENQNKKSETNDVISDLQAEVNQCNRDVDKIRKVFMQFGVNLPQDFFKILHDQNNSKGKDLDEFIAKIPELVENELKDYKFLTTQARIDASYKLTEFLQASAQISEHSKLEKLYKEYVDIIIKSRESASKKVLDTKLTPDDSTDAFTAKVYEFINEYLQEYKDTYNYHNRKFVIHIPSIVTRLEAFEKWKEFIKCINSGFLRDEKYIDFLTKQKNPVLGGSGQSSIFTKDSLKNIEGMNFLYREFPVGGPIKTPDQVFSEVDELLLKEGALIIDCYEINPSEKQLHFYVCKKDPKILNGSSSVDHFIGTINNTTQTICFDKSISVSDKAKNKNFPTKYT